MALIALIGVGILGGLLWAYLGSGRGGTSGSHTVKYAVLGHDGESITYQTGGQDSAQVTNDAVAWSVTETMSDGDYYSLSAQNQGSESILCTVSVDGIGVASNSSTGESAICTVSGNV